jgi:hypothetical protein
VFVWFDPPGHPLDGLVGLIQQRPGADPSGGRVTSQRFRHGGALGDRT